MYQATDKLCDILMIFQYLANKINYNYTLMSFFQDVRSARLSKRNIRLNEKSMVHTTQWPMQDGLWIGVSQSVDLGRSNNPNTTPTKDYEKVQVVVCLHGVQRGCAEEGKRGSTPTG